jgi:uroporphyrinogen-III synthase
MKRNDPTILCTQPLSEEMIEFAKSKGIRAYCLSFTRTQPILETELERILGPFSRVPIRAIFTSKSAVEIVSSYLPGKKPDWKIYCTGPSTRLAVEAHFGEKCIFAVAPSAAALAEAILARKGSGEMIFFCGRQRRDELPEMLSRGGIHVREIQVYESIPTPQPISMAYDGICFFSPGAVRSFFSLNAVPESTVFFALGKTTAEALAEYSQNEVIISETPAKEKLMEQALEYFQLKIARFPKDPEC